MKPNPLKSHRYAPVAQWIEHRIPNPGAAGSIPAGGTSNVQKISRLSLNWNFGILEYSPSKKLNNEN